MEIIEQNLNEVFDLFERIGNSDYLGEPISKTAHSVQCALLAEQTGATETVILGALFHDIGHLVGEEQKVKPMVYDGTNLGSSNHAALGAEFLKARGFDEDVTDLVRYHVLAKRYLCFKNPTYYRSLSWASKRTLEFQGGVMTDREAAKFESNPRFEYIIQLRRWDEMAKDKDWTDLKPLSYFRHMAKNYLINKYV